MAVVVMVVVLLLLLLLLSHVCKCAYMCVAAPVCTSLSCYGGGSGGGDGAAAAAAPPGLRVCMLVRVRTSSCSSGYCGHSYNSKDNFEGPLGLCS